MIRLIILFLILCNSLLDSVYFSQGLLKKERLDSISLFFVSGSSYYSNKKDVISQLNSSAVYPNIHIEIRAYTDTVGNIPANIKLASARAGEALSIIKGSRLKLSTFDTINVNEQHGDTSVSNAQSRRVDLIIYKVENNFVLNEPLSLMLNFRPGTDIYVRGADRTLAELLSIMTSDSSLKIKLHGHVCCEPDMKLSYIRAVKVRSYLVQKGIDPKRIECRGFSNTQRLVPERNDVDRAKNRRVEVIFYKD